MNKEDFFKDEYQDGEAEEKLSPSGKYRLVITRYNTSKVTGKPTWAYSRGRLYRVADGTLIVDIQRNYSVFYYSFQVKDGQEYLIAGRSYMGQTIINCDEGWEVSTPENYTGGEFCWAAHWLSPDGKTLVVDGCHWACPYELKFFDFTNPRELPLPELEFSRVDHDSYDIFGDGCGWKDGAFYAVADCERRKLDDKPFAGKWYADMTFEEFEAVETVAHEEGRDEDSYYEYVKVERAIFRRDGNKIVREVKV